MVGSLGLPQMAAACQPPAPKDCIASSYAQIPDQQRDRGLRRSEGSEVAS